MSAVPPKNQPAPEAGFQIFAVGEVYTVPEIAKRLKQCTKTVERKMKSHGIKAIRFGRITYLGADVNRVIEAEAAVRRDLPAKAG